MTPQGEPPRDPRAIAAARLAWLERLGFVALLFLVAFPRASSLADPFDRSPAGTRAARHAIAAVNSVRDPERGLELAPPAAASLSVAAARALGPRGWTATAKAQELERGPADLETVVRLPWFLLHLAGAAAFAFALRRAHGPGLAMLALAGWAVVPVGVLRAGMPGPENVVLAGALIAVAGAACLGPRLARPVGVGVALALGVGLAVTRESHGPVAALRLVDVGPGLACVAPVGVAARLARLVSPAARARLAPLEVGARAARTELVVPLALGSLAAFALAGEPLYLVPGIAAGFGAALSQVSEPLFRLRAGLAPLVALATLVAVPSLGLVEETRAAGGGLAALEEGRRLAEELPPGAPLPADRPELGWSDAYYAWRDLPR